MHPRILDLPGITCFSVLPHSPRDSDTTFKTKSKKNFFDGFFISRQGQGQPILWRGQIGIFLFLILFADSEFLQKKYERNVVFIFLYFNVNMVKIKKNVEICKQKNMELEIGSFI